MRLPFPRILTGVDFLRRFFPYANCNGHGLDIETARARNERETSAQRISVSPSLVYLWRERSTYVQAIGDRLDYRNDGRQFLQHKTYAEIE